MIERQFELFRDDDRVRLAGRRTVIVKQLDIQFSGKVHQM
jgi:hypothetical protein